MLRASSFFRHSSFVLRHWQPGVSYATSRRSHLLPVSLRPRADRRRVDPGRGTAGRASPVAGEAEGDHRSPPQGPSAVRSPYRAASCKQAPPEMQLRSRPGSSTCRSRLRSTAPASRRGAKRASSTRSWPGRRPCARRSIASSCSAPAVASYLGAKAPSSPPSGPSIHNEELPAKDRLGVPRIYFEGNNADNDALHDLLELLQLTCVEPDLQARNGWGVVVISKSGGTIETAAAYRAIRREMAEYYGNHSPLLNELLMPSHRREGVGNLHPTSSRPKASRTRTRLTIPENIGGRYSVFYAGRPTVPAARGRYDGTRHPRTLPCCRSCRGDDASASSRSRSSATRSCSSPRGQLP